MCFGLGLGGFHILKCNVFSQSKTLKKVFEMLSSIRSHGECFTPAGETVDKQQYALFVICFWEWAKDIHVPTVKYILYRHLSEWVWLLFAV